MLEQFHEAQYLRLTQTLHMRVQGLIIGMNLMEYRHQISDR